MPPRGRRPSRSRYSPYRYRTPVIRRPITPSIEIRRAQTRGVIKGAQAPTPPIPKWAEGIDVTPPEWGEGTSQMPYTGAEAWSPLGMGQIQPFDYWGYMQRIAAGPSARERLIQQALFAAEPFAYTGPNLGEALAGLQSLLSHPNVPKWSDYAPGGGGGYYASPSYSYAAGPTAKKGFSLGSYNWRIGI